MNHLTLLLALYNREIKVQMRSLKTKELSGGGWKEDAIRMMTRYILAAGHIGDASPDFMEATIKTWDEQTQGIDLLIRTAAQYDPDWIYPVRTLGRVAIKTVAEYRGRLSGALDKLLRGGADAGFISTFARSIDVQLTKAWNEGADTIGVAPDEMTPDDFKQLEAIIDNENQFITGVIDAIREDQGKEMDPEALKKKYEARVDVWANRYPDTVNRAIMWFGQQERLMWTLGDTEEHCSTCPKLNKIVAFGWEWDRAGVYPGRPPNDKIECGGWRCGCDCKPTKRRRSPRALERILSITGQS